jgi:hypothetical protein
VAPKRLKIPDFLNGVVEQDAYERWIKRKAKAHVKRDRKRGHGEATGSAYREAIHSAVVESRGKDAYTGEELHWKLISKYDNDESSEGRHEYKSKFALLPTVDHIDSASTSAAFRICSWRTNDSKNDLTLEEFRDLCIKVLVHAGYRVELDDSA